MSDFDVLVIGAGPAGVSSAIYSVRNGSKTCLIGTEPRLVSYTIENYYGFPNPISGRQLYENGVQQVKRLGVNFISDTVLGYIRNTGAHTVYTSKREYSAKALILALGAEKSRDPKIAGIDRFKNKNVSSCAVCDANSYKGLSVVVIGAGDYAAGEALVLARLAKKVRVYSHDRQFSISSELQTRLSDSGVELISATVSAIEGHLFAEGIRLEDGSFIECDGVFLAIDEPRTGDLAKKLGLRTDRGYISVNAADCSTSVRGVFAAGDCTGGLRQIAYAVGQGAVAGLAASEFHRHQSTSK